ncbi:MAG: hypothetical protein E7330_05035 [Clostridiales bacterium]|nr:hypothetical protein [Clostridiales bacterium]
MWKRRRGREGAALWAAAYRSVNEGFTAINEALTALLAAEGFSAATVSGTGNFDAQALRSSFSHRSAAVIAGIAVFGANRMAITEKGSAGRFSTLFTDAPLSAAQSAVKQRCPYLENGGCGLCFAACPAQALTGTGFDRFACRRQLIENGDALREAGELSADTCGRCISVCPLRCIE